MAKAKDGKTKAEWLAEAVAKAVGAGKPWHCETVDFSDPNRPPTCIEIDFPIIPINQIAQIEGNAGKPIYQMSKWWARRRSSVFRSMLLAAAIKAPSDQSESAKKVWEAYYGNHQKKAAFKNLKVADIFMGGGTTVVEGSRLGMQMFGNDINPVAWFVVKNEMAQVNKTEVEALLAEIEAEVKPQIMPFYTCDCPRGHKGRWIQISTGKLMGSTFDLFTLTPDQRKDYRYEGPEIIYVFWAKHGPCQVTGCGHRTPIMSSPVMALKELSIKYWSRECKHCGGEYDIEERDARMAPSVPLVIACTERPFAVAKLREGKNGQEPESAICPCCGKTEIFQILGKGAKKKVELTLLVHPNWLKGEPSKDSQGKPYGGSADDDVESTIRWNQVRAKTCQLIEVRGKLPDVIKCPTTGIEIKTGSNGGTVPGRSRFACGSCGNQDDIREAVSKTGKNGPVAMYAIQGYCPECDTEGKEYNGRFFLPVTNSKPFDASFREWSLRKEADLAPYWPRSEVPFGFMTAMANGDIRTAHGFTHWWKMFNPRQLVALALLLKTIVNTKKSIPTMEFVLGAFQQYLRNQNMFCFWDIGYDKLCPHMSNANYHPKSNLVENCVFPDLGRGNWRTQYGTLSDSIAWLKEPWDTVSNMVLSGLSPALESALSGKSEKAFSADPVLNDAILSCNSSTELSALPDASYDLVITDPPFGGLLHYSELADFFYVWLRLALKDRYPNEFAPEYTPKTLEAVANRARQPGKDEQTGKDNADVFYQRLLTACYTEARRILKPAGLLAFTFHHSEDAPWVSVLESLFDAGFYLQATYPIRSDETKGTGQFGSKMIEYDIIHVCRKRHEEPKPISWAKLRRQVLQDVRDLQALLEHHQKEGLPAADLQVIRRGKALEYYSRHYGKVFKDQGIPMTVLEALLGINQLLDEETCGVKDPPPHNAEPFTRMLLRLFDGKAELEKDQIQKFLRGSGSAPSEFVDRGWLYEERKIFYLRSPLDIAHEWVGKHRKGMTSDYDQAMYFIGACFEASGINASETLNNSNFSPHPALGALLTWFKTHGSTPQIRNAAVTASMLYHNWESKNQAKARQLSLFDLMGEDSVNG